jgi:membrane protein
MLQPAPNILEPGGTEVSTSAGGARRYRKALQSFRWCDIKALLGESFSEWSRHKGARLGASLAFYTLLSLTPLLLVVVSFAGLVFGPIAAESHVIWQIQSLVGREAANGIQALLEGTRHTTHGIIATAIGLLTLLFGASGVLIELRDALNTIWEIPPAQTTGFRTIMQMARERLFSFALVLAIGFLLLVSLMMNAAIAALGTFSAQFLPIPEVFLHLLNAVFSFVAVTALFASIYKVVPETKIQWRDVFMGAAVTSLLFTIGKLFIGLYLGKATFASTYGAAASVVVLIVWVYYSGQIFFLGAEFTKIFANRYGSQPTRHPTSMVTSSREPNSGPAVSSARILTPSGVR